MGHGDHLCCGLSICTILRLHRLARERCSSYVASSAGCAPGKPEVSEASPAQPAFDAAAVVKASASGNVQSGAETFKKCEACHDGTKGGPNKVGPNLWGVVGRPKASHEEFAS